MNRFAAAGVLAVLAACSTSPVQAQQFNTLNPLPTRAPTAPLPPALLLNGLNGNNPAVNYYLGVIPEQQRRQFQSNTGSALLNLERQYQSPTLGVNEAVPTLPATGHAAVFNNLGGYFNSGTGAQRAPTPPQQGGLPPKK